MNQKEIGRNHTQSTWQLELMIDEALDFYIKLEKEKSKLIKRQSCNLFVF